MKDFKLLPSSPEIQNLTQDQLSFILINYHKDAMEAQRRSGNGIDESSSNWWTVSEEEFEPIVEGHDETELARQAQLLFERTNGENSLAEVDKHIAMRLKELQDESAELEKRNAPKNVNNLAELEAQKAFENLDSGISDKDIQTQIEQIDDDDDFYI